MLSSPGAACTRARDVTEKWMLRLKRLVVARALVRAQCRLAPHSQALSKALWDIDLALILSGKRYFHPLAQGRGGRSDVHRHVEDLPLQHVDELALGVGVLKVEPAQNSLL